MNVKKLHGYEIAMMEFDIETRIKDFIKSTERKVKTLNAKIDKDYKVKFKWNIK